MQLFQGFKLTLVTLLSVIFLAFSHDLSSGESLRRLNESEVDFVSFRRKFNRKYEEDGEEYKRRYFYFKNSTERHILLNSFSSEPQSAQYGFNQFSDLSQEEFRHLYLRAVSHQTPLFSGLTTPKLSAKLDWRDKGVVAAVQDQRACGSCWAFSVVGAVQSVHAIGGSQLELLSVQQLLDCSFQNDGCDGGSPSTALHWLTQTRLKLATRSEYPYRAKTQSCRFFAASHGVVAVRNFTAHDFSGQEEAMMVELQERGPLVAVVDAVSWQDYLGGIIQHHCSSRCSNHAVLVVGYDATGTVPYWIVQNSWGPAWGDRGYVYIKMGGNVCGIADSVAAVFL